MRDDQIRMLILVACGVVIAAMAVWLTFPTQTTVGGVKGRIEGGISPGQMKEGNDGGVQSGRDNPGPPATQN